MNININLSAIWPFGTKDVVSYKNQLLTTNFKVTGTSGNTSVINLNASGGPMISFYLKYLDNGLHELTARIAGVSEQTLETFPEEKDAKQALHKINKALNRGNSGFWFPAVVILSALMLVPPAAQLITASAKATEAASSMPTALPSLPSPSISALPPLQPEPVQLKPGSISLEGAIHFGNQKSGKTLYVFSDPQCPYCREQEAELKSLEKEYSIYVFPTAFKDGSPQMAKTVLCSSDQQGSWKKTMQGDFITGNTQCEKAKFVESNLNAFRMLGLSATPTLISSEGLIHPGYLSADEVRVWAK